jgi:hypothetical protein
VIELRALTSLGLIIGEPWPADLDPRATPLGEIHVGYVRNRIVRALAHQCARKAGFGGAITGAGGRWYTRGFAAVSAVLALPDPTADEAMTILRHELAHALGLGHAMRRGLVMHYQHTSGLPGYGPGDRHGLQLLGPALASPVTTSR